MPTGGAPHAAGRPLSGNLPTDPPFLDRDPDVFRRQSLQQQLGATRRELEELRNLLDTLPEIFERKFQERLAPMLTQRQRLLEQNGHLRRQMDELQVSPACSHGQPRLRGQAGSSSLGRALRHAFGFEARRAA
jgi:hypothetical protein